MPLPALSEILDEYELLDREDRYRLLIDLGRKLEPMPDALKTDATKVRGCSADVWVYPAAADDGRSRQAADGRTEAPRPGGIYGQGRHARGSGAAEAGRLGEVCNRHSPRG